MKLFEEEEAMDIEDVKKKWNRSNMYFCMAL